MTSEGVVLEVFRALEARDREALFALWCDDIVLTEAASLPYSGQAGGKEAIGRQLDEAPERTWIGTWEPLQPTEAERRLEPRIVAARGDEVVVRYTTRGVAPDGERYESDVLGIYVVRDGRLASATMYHHDTAALAGFLARAAGGRTRPVAGTAPRTSTGATHVPGGALAVIEFVRSLPYGRPSVRTTEAMLAERRGTCSTKHAFLWQVLEERFPELRPALVHRVYDVTREQARLRFGQEVADVIPAEGLTDVHRFLEVRIGGRRIHVDATFPDPPWDGAGSMPLACGAGSDHPVTGDPDVEKRALEARYCDPRVREPFIAALSAATGHG